MGELRGVRGAFKLAKSCACRDLRPPRSSQVTQSVLVQWWRRRTVLGYPQPADSLPDTRPPTCWPRPLFLFVYCTIPELAYATEKKSPQKKTKNCQAVVVAAEKTKKKKEQKM